MKLNILHLFGTDFSKGRYDSFMKQLSEQAITDFKIWPGIYDKWMPPRGINRSHKQIITDAKEKGLPNVCVMEDDVCFYGKGAFDFFVSNIPDEYDIFLGSLSNGKPDDHGVVKWFRGMSLYIVNNCFYDTFLAANEKLDIDAALANKGLFRVCPEVVCYQADGYSYHKKAVKQYSRLTNQYKRYVSKEEDISEP